MPDDALPFWVAFTMDGRVFGRVDRARAVGHWTAGDVVARGGAARPRARDPYRARRAPASIVKLVLRAGMLRVALGLAVGVVCTAIWDHIFASPNMLTAPDNLAVVAGLMTAVGAAACLWPAYRATRVDPRDALRRE